MRTAHVDTFVRDNLPKPELQPVFMFDRPELQFPDSLNASTLLDQALSAGHADRDAVRAHGERLTYRDLLGLTNRVANVLRKRLSLKPGNRVLIHAPNTPMTLAAWWAVLRAGGVAVTTMPMLRAKELTQIIDKARISHALVHATLETEFEGARKACGSLKKTLYFGPGGELEKEASKTSDSFSPLATRSDDPALIAFTSGTTGQPKGCIHYHRDVLAMAETFCRHILKPRPDDVFCGTPPFAFTFGLGAAVVFPAACGATTALPAAPGYDKLMDAIAEHNVTTLFTAPTGYRALLKTADERLARLRACVSAGEHLPEATSQAWRDATGIRLIDGIGATEMIHIFISASGNDIVPGSTGRAVPGYTAQVVDEEMRPLPPGEPGRLAVRGPTGCRYLADDRQRKYVVNGWNITGDLFRMDERGYFWFVSRADDMIISSGYNIAATEVEGALLKHAAVAETAVVAVPDEERGQIAKAYVVLQPGYTPSDALTRELQDFVKGVIAPYKYPRAIDYTDQLPKTQTGKLQRYRLREQA